MSLSVTRPAKQFQLFHPIGGVSAILSPTLKTTVRVAVPFAFVAVKRTA